MAITAPTGAAHALLARLEAEGKLDERLRPEVLNGELVIRGFGLIRHEEAVSALHSHVATWAGQHGGRAFTGAGIELGGHQLGPDLSFIGADRVGELDADGFRVAPDLVVEVTSPGTRSLDVSEKRDVYAEIGVGEYWVVDLPREVVVVHRRDQAGGVEATEHAEGTLTTPAAPGLEIAVASALARPRDG
jgi:Uma2 family endonuclease